MAVIDSEDMQLDNPYLIKLTTKDRLAGKSLGADLPLDGLLIAKPH